MIKINKNGQSLVEALIALGVATIVVSAMAVAAITAVNNADFSKYQNLATQYAQQGMEILRQRSQADWTTDFSPYIGKLSCIAQDSTTLDSPPTGMTDCAKNIKLQPTDANPFFVRDVMLTQTPADDPNCHGTVLATVNVLWTDGKCLSGSFCHNATLNSCFANINAVGP